MTGSTYLHDLLPEPLMSVSDPDPRPQAPEKPLPAECCESGCAVCIWDTYAEELLDYQERLEAWKLRHPDQQ